MSSKQALLVPMNVTALCVSQRDQLSGMKFGSIAADFQNLETQPYLGSSVVPRPFDEEPAPAGIHLHWALPDALTRSDPSKEEGLRRAPNRFLVVRLAVTDEAPAKFERMAWVVESDYLWKPADKIAREGDPRNALSRAVPLEYATTKDRLLNPTFAYQGRVRLLANNWNDTGSDLQQRFTAFGYGTEAYAAAYPHCRNLFGFFDPCHHSVNAPDGLESKHRHLSYLVIGWYSKIDWDPITLIQTRADEVFKAEVKKSGPGGANVVDLKNKALAAAFEADYRWSYKCDDWNIPGAGIDNRPVRTRRPERTLFVGQVTTLEWKPDQTYSTPNAERVSVALGTTAAEALSAVLASTQDPGKSADVETLLNDLQFDLLREYATAAGQAGLPDARHQRDFSPMPAGHASAKDSGRIWVIKRAGAAEPADQLLTTRTDDLADAARALGLGLPENLANALHALNLSQAAYDDLAAAIATRRGQVFADWTTYLVSKDDDAKKYIEQEIKSLADLVLDLTTKETARNGAKNELEDLLRLPEYSRTPTGDTALAVNVYELESVAAPRFYQPNDPVILLSGVNPSTQYGGDGRFDPDKKDNLICRLSHEITTTEKLATLTQGQRSLLANSCAREGWIGMIPQALPLPDDLISLCVEACLLNPWMGKLIGSADLVQWQMDYVAGKKDDFKGAAPSPIGLTQYAQPWIPLILQWETAFRPFQAISAANGIPTAYPEMWGLQKVELSDSDPEIPYTGANPGFSGSGPTTYRGTVTLTHNVQVSLTGQIERYLKDHPVDPKTDSPAIQEMKRTLQAVWHLPFRMMAQSMDGFHKQMLMRSSTLQCRCSIPRGRPT